jgi:hypothetical protein
MNEMELAEILTEHADKLNRGEDISAQYMAQHPEDPAELNPLFGLAKSVKTVLVPVRATAYKSSLRQRLDGSSQRGRTLRAVASKTNIVWISVAAAGSLLSIAGLVLIVLKKIKASARVDRQAATAAAG